MPLDLPAPRQDSETPSPDQMRYELLQRQPGSFLRTLGQGTASALDNTIGSIIPYVAQMATHLGLRTGDQIAALTANMFGKQYQADPEKMGEIANRVGHALSQPFGKAFGVTKTPGYKGEATSRVMEYVGEKMDTAAGKVAEQTGLPKGDILWMANAALPRVAEGVGARGKMVAQDIKRAAQGEGPLFDIAADFAGAPLNVVKEKGGNWLTGSLDQAVEGIKLRDRYGMTDPRDLAATLGIPLDEAKQIHAQNLPTVAINNWIDTKLKKYMRDEMGTPSDPIRALAEKGVLHVDPAQLPYGQRTVHPSGEVFPKQAQSESAKVWERASDNAIHPRTAAVLELARSGESGIPLTEKYPWLSKLEADTPVYDLSARGSSSADLGFNHLVDEMRNATRADSDLPPSLRIDPMKLDKITVPQMVEKVSKINEWRANQKAEANAKLARNPATQVVKEYPDQGYSWVELKLPEVKELPEGYSIKPIERDGQTYYAVWEPPTEARPQGRSTGAVGKTPEEAIASQDFGRETLEQALKYEGDTMGHCVGGYCPEVMAGEARIFSLRDKKGEPHVTVEVRPMAFFERKAAEMKQAGASAEEIANFFKDPPLDVIQVKGKQNKLPKAEYQEMVKDFLNSQKWGKVEETGGLIDTQNPRSVLKFGERYPEQYPGSTVVDLFNAAVDVEPNAPRFMTPQEFKTYISPPTPPKMAKGGKVHFATTLDGMRHELIRAR